MQPSQKTFGILFLFVFLIIFSVFLIPPFYTGGVKSTHDNVSLYYEESHLYKTPISEVKPESSPSPILATNPSNSIEDATVSQSNFSVVSDPIHIQIQDAAGYPINQGHIVMGQESIPFKNGELILEKNQVTGNSISVYAEGYQTTKSELTLQDNNPIVFQLEYLSDYEIRVWDEKDENVPVAGAEVVLSQVRDCPRPLPERYRVWMGQIGLMIFYEMEFSKNGLIIRNVSVPKMFQEGLPNFPETQAFFPVQDDIIQSIGTCSWNQSEFVPTLSFPYIIPLPHNRSSQARMLDTLNYATGQRGSKRFLEKVVVRQDVKEDSFVLELSLDQGGSTEVQRQITNNEGRCFFKNIPPGFYFVQAHRDHQYSFVRSLLPTTGGVNLKLASKGMLGVVVDIAPLISGYNIIPPKVILEESHILLHTISEKGGLISKRAQNGFAMFSNLEFGLYHLTVTPPEGCGYAKDEREISFFSPSQQIYVPLRRTETHSIEGEIIHTETKEPIEGIRLQLLTLSYGNSVECAESVSDERGKFIFRDLPKGEYKIAQKVETSQDLLYFLSNEELSQSRIEAARPFIGRNYDEKEEDHFSPSIRIENDPVYYIQLKMISCSETHFSGRVIDRNHNPVAGAYLEVRPFKGSMRYQGKLLVPRIPINDEEGRFQFSMITKNTTNYLSHLYDGEIRARVAEVTPRQYREVDIEGNKRVTLDPNETTLNRALGSQFIQFRLGDVIQDIEIVVDDQEIYDLEGRILTEEKRPLPHLSLSTWQQGDKSLPAFYNPETGDFAVRGIEADDFALLVLDAYQPDPAFPKNQKYYQNENIHFNKKQFQKFIETSNADRKLKMEILLSEGGYITGIVVDEEKKPVPLVLVQTEPDLGKALWTFTNDQGFFYLHSLDPNREYELCLSQGQETPQKVTSNITPDTENILLSYKKTTPNVQ